MKKHIKNTKNLIMSHKVISAVLLVIILFVGYKISAGSSKQEFYTVKTGDVTQKVIVNGKTKAVHAVSLGFEANGRVSGVYAVVGSRVVLGQTLVSLESGELQANLSRAQANVDSEQARLDELRKGTRPEEIAVAETEKINAETSLRDAEKKLADKVVDVVNNNVDQLFSNPHSTNPQINIVLSDSQLKEKINFSRLVVENIVQTWSTEKIDINLPKVSELVDNVALAVNTQTATPTLSQTTLDGYKSSLSTARSALISAKESVNSARSALSLAEKNLLLKKGGSTPEAIKAQEARVLQYSADLQSARAQLGKMTLRSPQNGIVTLEDAKVGEIVTPGKIVVSIISDSDLEVESNVSEVSVGKVAIGNPVNLVFDAFPGQVFHGSVTYIEPAETVVDGVVNYKIKVAFSEKYPQMKSGLTSKLDIITAIKKDVLVIPQYSVVTKSNGTFVTKNSGKIEVPVTIGLTAQDGTAEVLSGLTAGEVIDMHQ